MSELLSVIVPVYNVEKYLQRCVDSITSQTYKDLEILLVDDGSKDGSGLLCDRLAEKDERIKVLHQENGGLSKARNTGIDNANGSYLAFIDSDDYIHPKMFEILMDTVGKKDVQIASCDFRHVSESEEISYPEVNGYSCKVYEGDEMFDLLVKKDTQTVVQCTKVFSRDIFSDIRFPLGRLHEDVFVIHRELLACGRFAFVDLPLYYYVQRDGSIMKSESLKGIRDAIAGYEDRIDCFLENKKENAAKQSAKTLFDYIEWKYGIYYFEYRKDLVNGIAESSKSLDEKYGNAGCFTKRQLFFLKNIGLCFIINRCRNKLKRLFHH